MLIEITADTLEERDALISQIELLMLGICFLSPFIFLVLKIISDPRLLDILVIRPLKVRSSKRYFMERFGPAFFMRPAYCTDCNKKPIKVKDADLEEHVRAGLNAEDPICPECYWVMNVSSWERFRGGFLDGTFTVEEFEDWERITYMNEKFLSETLNQKS